MIERAGEFAFAHRFHGGTGETRVEWHGFGRLQLPVAVQTWHLPPGASEGMHTHDPAADPLEELYVVIAGTGRMRVDDTVYDVSAGDSVVAASGSAHDLVNTGDDELRVLVVWGPPGDADWSAYGSAQKARRARER
ncbi:cupin domain-containing protein [Flexivirga oryzae]|jgi:mannose-6-phosphate isomerase-like protein (cupin superfamily)|uniref:Mannose-6-phosphate isomerase-like protein (Cupin superfamily) n=1 Tax=Flexivirga oryzae TaxID=1794944 RepID=A0A839NAE7_9MICO|nr:cupin domain-containing protein [Flexivirga oryzae]MBB2893173.1 mannose-6-phosphate isomerase-like protein (cupin superfamily) [Flexivirga oryzae]